jgi:addiction module HigA family antidote
MTKAQSPGEFLTNMMEKYGISAQKMSDDVFLTVAEVRRLCADKAKITAAVALRLSKYFDTQPEYWFKMQSAWELSEAIQDKQLMDSVKKISKFKKAPAPSGKTASTGRGKAVSAKKTAGTKGKPKAATAKAKTAKAGAKPKTAGKRGRKPAAK